MSYQSTCIPRLQSRRTETLSEQPLAIGKILAGPARRAEAKQANRGCQLTCLLFVLILAGWAYLILHFCI